MVLALPVAIALVVSGISPYERGTWWLEVAPVLVAFPLIALTWQRFPLTTLLCVMIALHAIVLVVGGAYTYARVPLGFVLQEWLDLARNPYGRIGHFMQGFGPTLVAREILVRGEYVRGPRMLTFICICIAFAISALYELIEWWAALALGEGATEFLGTQGDQWDTLADMFCALIGALAALLLLSRRHDVEIARVTAKAAEGRYEI
ncbi:MAG TPA: DUF2238 domain-containing protein [Casimicrobiaceae bacterium]|nr:DUF2238 domain-containing protein [Casimicrobiaceae bacterium]